MKLLSSLIAASLCYAGRAAANDGARILLLDPDRYWNWNGRVSSQNAQLILASRNRVSYDYSLSDADEETLRILNTYGKEPQQLFGQEQGSSRTEHTIYIEGYTSKVWDTLRLKQGNHIPLFIYDKPDLQSISRESIQELAAVGREVNRVNVDSRDSLEEYLAKDKSSPSVTYEPILLNTQDSERDFDNALKYISSSVSSIFEEAMASQRTITVVLLPDARLAPKRKGGAIKPAHAAYHVRRKEELLSAPHSSPSESSPATSPNDVKINPLATPTRIGIIAPCFSSLAACESGTYNCTGHGSCVLKHKVDDSACYSCGCKPSVHKYEDGRILTTKWGGPACNKKDISIPFWILLGVTVFLVFLVTWGIGLIWGMGEEDLPGVIGAGVAGPRATK